MKKLVVVPALLAKAHIDQYVRKDGAVVQAHDDSRQAAAPKPATVVKTRNEGQGFHGEAYSHHLRQKHGPDNYMDNATEQDHVAARAHADKLFSSTANKLVQAGHFGSHEDAREYLDSKSGRHLHNQAPDGDISKVGWLAKDVKNQKDLSDYQAKTASGAKLAPPVKRSESALKTGSAAKANIHNVGTEKYPLLVKHSEKLPAKHADGSTHHVPGFEPPSSGKGDHAMQHDGKTFSFTGKSGKNTKTGEASYEYAHHGDNMEHRAWVTHSGHLMND